jgi:hypothetical protein
MLKPPGFQFYFPTRLLVVFLVVLQLNEEHKNASAFPLAAPSLMFRGSVTDTQPYSSQRKTQMSPPMTATATALWVSSSSSSASELLYQDQQAAMHRRALREEELLSERNKPQELFAANIKAGPPKAGTGFANKVAMSVEGRLAAEQAKALKRDGVLRLNNVLSFEVADQLRQYFLDQQQVYQKETERDPSLSMILYGVEQARKNRCDMVSSYIRVSYFAQCWSCWS